MNTIKVSDITIPKVFSDSHPKEYKLDRIRAYVDEHGKLDKPIVVNSDKVLTDNYIRYLVAVEKGLENVSIVSAQEYRRMFPEASPTMTYVVGKFYQCDKEYTWKNPKDISIDIGDKVLVVSKTKHGKIGRAIMTGTKIFKSNNPKLLRHKPVVKNLSKK